jgi:hypothetical protein
MADAATTPLIIPSTAATDPAVLDGELVASVPNAF